MGMIENIKRALSGTKTPAMESNEPTQWKDKDGNPLFVRDILNHVNDFHMEKRLERAYQELQWRLNMNFRDGYQYTEINTVSMRIEESTRFSSSQEMEVINMIAPVMETRQSKLKKLNLSPKTRPASNDSEDISRAKVSNKVLEGVTQDKSLSRLQNVANAWAETTGTAFWCHSWNPNKGRIVGIIKETGPDGEEIETPVYEGDYDVEVASPFEFFPDSLWNNDVDQCRAILRVRAVGSDDIMMLYGKSVDGKEVSVFSLSGASYNNGGAFQKNGSAILSTRKKKNSVQLMEYWEMPSYLYPEGRLIICTDDALFHAGDLPYKIGPNNTKALPFRAQKCIEVEGQFFGRSIVERMIPAQRRYNAIKNRKAEHLARCTIGNLIYEEGSIDETLFTATGLAPGDMVPVSRGTTFEPKFMSPPVLSPQFSEEEASYERLFNVLSGVSEVSRDSTAPTGISSGTALQILQEQDDTRLSLTGENIRLCVLENARIALRMYKQYATGQRISKTVGRSSKYDVIEWTGSDLNSDDIYIEANTLLSETLAQRRQMVFDLLNNGLFSDPDTGNLTKEGRAKVFEMIELGDWENFDDGDIASLHFQKAQRENRKILQGEPVQVAEIDDDILHLSQHNSYRLGAEYEELLEKDPEKAAAFDAHAEEHINAMAQKAQQQMPLNPQMPQMPQGGVPNEEPPTV